MFSGSAATTNDEVVADLMTLFTEWLYSHVEFQHAPVSTHPARTLSTFGACLKFSVRLSVLGERACY